MSPAAWVYLYDNLSKIHSKYSVVFGSTQTHTVGVTFRYPLALPRPKLVQIKYVKRTVFILVYGIRIES